VGEVLKGVRAQDEFFVRFVESLILKGLRQVVSKDERDVGGYLRQRKVLQVREKLLKGNTGIGETAIVEGIRIRSRGKEADEDAGYERAQHSEQNPAPPGDFDAWKKTFGVRDVMQGRHAKEERSEWKAYGDRRKRNC